MEQVLFPLGLVCVTWGINDQMISNDEFSKFVWQCLARHTTGDWGDLCQEDKQENERALKQGSGRIFSAYYFQGQKIYIITESDRSISTILFPSEY